MRLKKIKIQNYKAIKDLNMVIDGNIYVVKGDNDKGKTTFGRAFQRLVTKMDKPEMPVSQGEARGTIEGRFEAKDGDIYTVMLDFTNDKETIRMVSPDGLSTSKVGEIRDFFNYTNVDVDEFISWSSTAEGRRKQRDIVLNLLDPEIKTAFKELEAKEKKTYDERTEANHSVSYINNKLEDSILSPPDRQVLENAEEIEAEYNKAKEIYETIQKNVGAYNLKKEKIDNKRSVIEQTNTYFRDKINGLTKESDTLKSEIDQLKSQIEAKEGKLKSIGLQAKEFTDATNDGLKILNSELEELEDEIKQEPGGDTEQAKDQFNEAFDAKENLLAIQNKNESFLYAKENMAKEKEKADKLSENLSSIREEKQLLIINSNLPVKGLSVGDDGILLNNYPFTKEQLSTSEILITVFRIMTAMNKKTPIFYLGRVESLGDAKLNEIVSIAEKEGYQLFLDKVESGEDLTIEVYEDLK